MDAVITFVDGGDPLWQDDFRAARHGKAVARRYRDWGTLPFLLRGIERHMPFIDRVFLVVARESQVPSWADRSRLQIVLHSDIIPSMYLPTFNSTTIEMFLHRIPGLSERFIYFNDDIFPVMDAVEEDFYPGGRPATGFSRHLLALNTFKRQTRRSDRLARLALVRAYAQTNVIARASSLTNSSGRVIWREYRPERLVEAGPIPLKAECKDGKVVISFKNAEGLKTSDGKRLRGFQLKEENGDSAFW